MTMTLARIHELRAALDAEHISYDELHEIDSAFDEIDPATLPEPAENAMAGDKLDELEARAKACRYCGAAIEGHKGAWWTGVDFQCADGENNHEPRL